jgi:hypothetical protein
MICASFDIGKKNFSFCVEEFDVTNYSNIDLPKILYNPDGTSTPRMTDIIKNTYMNGSIILLENVDITENCDPKVKLDPETFHNMTDVLDKYAYIWDRCSVFIIEKQMQFGKQTNPMAMKLGQHCYSYFAFKYGRFKEIIEFPAYNKTQILGAQKVAGKKTKSGKVSYKAIDKPTRKKWCISKACEILLERGDEEHLSLIKKSKKKDDLCDVICQLQSWKILHFNPVYKK